MSKEMKKLIALLLALVMVIGLVACTSGQETSDTTANTDSQDTSTDTSTEDTGSEDSESSGGNYTIAMLPKFKGENYFDGCYVGAQQAADDLGIELVYDGPNQSEATNAKQVEILEGFIAAGRNQNIVPSGATGGDITFIGTVRPSSFASFFVTL